MQWCYCGQWTFFAMPRDKTQYKVGSRFVMLKRSYAIMSTLFFATFRMAITWTDFGQSVSSRTTSFKIRISNNCFFHGEELPLTFLQPDFSIVLQKMAKVSPRKSLQVVNIWSKGRECEYCELFVTDNICVSVPGWLPMNLVKEICCLPLAVFKWRTKTISRVWACVVIYRHPFCRLFFCFAFNVKYASVAAKHVYRKFSPFDV